MTRNLPMQYYFNGEASFNRQEFVNDQVLWKTPGKRQTL